MPAQRFFVIESAHNVALILFYGASTSTTLVPTLYYALTEQANPKYTTLEFGNILATYIPFLLIPLGMALDMGVKLAKMVQIAEGRKSI